MMEVKWCDSKFVFIVQSECGGFQKGVVGDERRCHNTYWVNFHVGWAGSSGATMFPDPPQRFRFADDCLARWSSYSNRPDAFERQLGLWVG